MKRRRQACLSMALLAALLTGCGGLLETEYVSVTPHTEQRAVEEHENVLTAENYLSLKNAILSLVENGVEEGSIRIYEYSGDVEKDVAEATYEVAKNDPLGAYAVDYMTHECVLIVSYYEVRVNIKFRRTPEQIASIQRAPSINALEELVGQTMSSYGEELTARLSYYSGQDVEAMVREYYRDHPATAMEMPEVTVHIYPDQGYVRIIEVLMEYDQTAEELMERQDAVATSTRAAREYVRYRDTETEKLQLLYTYLLERFSYRPGITTTPVYSFLCEGVAGSEGCAKSLQIICDEMELECRTVEGSRGGEPYFWNIVCVDGVYCHADLLRSLLEGRDSLTLYQDSAMTDYYWDAGQYPACQ